MADISKEELSVTLKEFIDLAAQIKETKAELKIVGERKKELEAVIIAYLKQTGFDSVSTQAGCIKLFKTKSKAALNEDYLRDALSQKIDLANIDVVIEAAFASRPITVSDGIKLNLKK